MKLKIGDIVTLKWGQVVYVDEVYEDGSFKSGYTIYGQNHIKKEKLTKEN